LAVAHEADLLIHDAQYTNDEYSEHVGWGHSSVDHALAFAQLAGARRLVLFHHDPAHDDSDIERMEQDARGVVRDVVVEAAREGTTVTLPGT
jgi:ribonuclease BN (tRNA processing enzyme)